MLLKITQAAAIGGIAVIVENGVALAIGEGGELCALPICEAEQGVYIDGNAELYVSCSGEVRYNPEGRVIAIGDHDVIYARAKCRIGNLSGIPLGYSAANGRLESVGELALGYSAVSGRLSNIGDISLIYYSFPKRPDPFGRGGQGAPNPYDAMRTALDGKLHFFGEREITYAPRTAALTGIGSTRVDVSPRDGRLLRIGSTELRYSAAGRLTAIGDMPISYSPKDGRIIAIGTYALEYSPAGGRLIAVTEKK